MKFTSPYKMLKYIQDGNDIWSPELEFYVFLYSELGSICYYRIDYDEAKMLEKSAQEREPAEYWASFLGVGGYICDTIEWFEDAIKSGADIAKKDISNQALNFCKDNYLAEWINCSDVLKIV